MSHQSRELQAYYAARAPYYDAVYLRPERKEDIAFLCAHLPAVLAGRRVLEVACGTGYWTQYIAKTAACLTATDAAVEPLQFAMRRPGTSRVRFVQADAYHLPGHLGVFDAAFAGLWFSHVPIEARRDFLASLHARLEPGSRVVFLDNSAVQLNDFPIAETDRHGNTYQHRTLRDGTTHRVLKNFPTEEELVGMLAGAATVTYYRPLQNFWLLEYRLNAP